MKIVLAFDKFKGAFSAAEACSAAAEGIASCHRRTDCIQIPIADGGEGTAEVICEVLGGAWHGLAVNDPLGRMVEVEFAVVDQGDGRRTAVMEMSAASGLWRVSGEDLDPWRASTYGTGEMIAAAAKMGVDKILIGIGGSATNDGGSGMAYGLGVQFLDKTGSVIVKLPEKLTYSDNISTLNIISLPEIVVACDVTNPLLGERGATRIYGAQKGVSEAGFSKHVKRFNHLADLVVKTSGNDFRDVPGAGAAGGLGFGLLSFCGARLEPGFDLVAEILGLEEKIAGADLVITGEGMLDAQTAEGKGPAGVAELARKHGKPVFAFGGKVDPGARGRLSELFDGVYEICPPGWGVERSIAAGVSLLRDAVEGCHDLHKLGGRG